VGNYRGPAYVPVVVQCLSGQLRFERVLHCAAPARGVPTATGDRVHEAECTPGNFASLKLVYGCGSAVPRPSTSTCGVAMPDHRWSRAPIPTGACFHCLKTPPPEYLLRVYCVRMPNAASRSAWALPRRPRRALHHSGAPRHGRCICTCPAERAGTHPQIQSKKSVHIRFIQVCVCACAGGVTVVVVVVLRGDSGCVLC
jgi:hypothetical protein